MSNYDTEIAECNARNAIDKAAGHPGLAAMRDDEWERRTHTPMNVAAAVLDAQASGVEPCSSMLTHLEATVTIDADGNVHVAIEGSSLAVAVAEMLEG